MLSTSTIKKLNGFRLKTTPSIVPRLRAALLTMQAPHQHRSLEEKAGSDPKLLWEGTNHIL